MSGEPTNKECGPRCGAIATERSRYFTGKFMAARDFADEQEYFLSRHRLHNRLLHGWGVICGLRVTLHERPECRNRWVVVHAGIALDCCGREVILEETVHIALPEPLWETPYLCLAYAEEPVEFLPALYAEGGCDPSRKEANRVREGAVLKWVSRDELGDAWIEESPGEGCCRDGSETHDEGCIEPDCPGGHCIPIARLIPAEDDLGYAIETRGRPTLPAPGDYLTHIVKINWKHGEEISLSALRDEMGGALKITFDRKLAARVGEKTGVNMFTFVVQYGGIQETLEFLPWESEPYLSEDGCAAIYPIRRDLLETVQYRDNIAGNVVRVTARCDFWIDCVGNPVDGAHLRGQLPTRSGSPGGEFCSWFRVVHDSQPDPKGGKY